MRKSLMALGICGAVISVVGSYLDNKDRDDSIKNAVNEQTDDKIKQEVARQMSMLRGED